MDKILFQKELVWDTDSIDDFVHKYELDISPAMVAAIMHEIEEYGGYDDIVDVAYSDFEKYTAIVCQRWINRQKAE